MVFVFIAVVVVLVQENFFGMIFRSCLTLGLILDVRQNVIFNTFYLNFNITRRG
jgi:hypothetical protein